MKKDNNMDRLIYVYNSVMGLTLIDLIYYFTYLNIWMVSVQCEL